MIPIKEEPKDYFDNTKLYERCHFCQQQTRYWHENTNNPVCKPCSKKHKVSELPDFGQTIRRNKLKAREKSTVRAKRPVQQRY